MGKPLADSFAAAREVFQEVDDALNRKLSRLMWEGPESELLLTENAQPAIMAASYAIIRVLQRDGGLDLAKHVRLVAGHSLGSQVAYDCINKLNLLINQEQIEHYNYRAECTLLKYKGLKIDNQLSGFITFGCPLDKIIFFLRENVPDNEYVRQQMLDHFHGFQ